MFANTYLQKNTLIPRIRESAHPALGIVVVIPCFREPEIIRTLDSIKECQAPRCFVEVIVLINHSEASSEVVKHENRTTQIELDAWITGNSAPQIKFFAVGPVALKKKWAGAGLARKNGMDEAVIRFNSLQNPEGIIVSLDADTLVERNYLLEIERFFSDNSSSAGATISFRHRTKGLEERHRQGILLYEKYMEYYKQALEFTGYPYPMFTLGSAFAVRAGAYVKRGGMNRRQAGEDFYFLQNLVQVGKVGEISNTTVHPSARISDRVPFGTGPVLKKWMEGEEDISKTYSFDAFTDLKYFFKKLDALFHISSAEYETMLMHLPVPVAAFLKESDFHSELVNLNENCATLNAFRLRFFYLFNAFKIFRFLNFTHGRYYEKADLFQQFDKLNNNK